jgi:hypothetical protein
VRRDASSVLRQALKQSGRPDLNGRPPAPQAGALNQLRYAPILSISQNPAYCPLEKFFILKISLTSFFRFVKPLQQTT